MKWLPVVFCCFPIVCSAGFAPGIVNHKANKSERTRGNDIKSETQCKSKAGQWAYGYCVLPYADAGKTCRSSKACIGHCIALVPEVGESQNTDHGSCQENDDPDDCGSPILKMAKSSISTVTKPNKAFNRTAFGSRLT